MLCIRRSKLPYELRKRLISRSIVPITRSNRPSSSTYSRMPAFFATTRTFFSTLPNMWSLFFAAPSSLWNMFTRLISVDCNVAPSLFPTERSLRPSTQHIHSPVFVARPADLALRYFLVQLVAGQDTALSYYGRE